MKDPLFGASGVESVHLTHGHAVCQDGSNVTLGIL